MVLEVHLTLAAGSCVDTASLSARVATLGMKVTHIELPQGDYRSQLMVSARFAALDADLMALVDGLRTKLTAATGLRVVRTKLESFLGDALHAMSGVDAQYLEHHVKVLVAPGTIDCIAAIAEAQAAHLSRNAFSKGHDGQTTRFLTQRFASAAVDASGAALERLQSALAERSVAVLKIERERVLYDDNVALDAGWSAS